MTQHDAKTRAANHARAWTPATAPPLPHFQRRCGGLFQQHVLPAAPGCDFDCLLGGPTPEPAIFL
jgi:hypothetical protein